MPIIETRELRKVFRAVKRTPGAVGALRTLFSREVVERVVWEVVPQLAEAMIKEEITRLTRG